MLKTVQEVSKDILAGRCLALAGDEHLLAQLPKGNWVAGTTPYFMDIEGGAVTQTRLFEEDLTSWVASVSIRSYGEADLPRIPADAPDQGFSILIIPATSRVHLAYAEDAPNYPGLFMKPIVGWISGVLLADLGRISPKVFNGATGTFTDQEAVVMHCTLPAGRMASLGFVNLFRQGDGPVFSFEQEGFSVRDCLVDGRRARFADILSELKVDTRLPLVANYAGARVNASFQGVREAEGVVDLYAPVFKDVEYRLAAPVADYVRSFDQALPQGTRAAFSCNCILNFLYSNLEGKVTHRMAGPVTFGEIAYQLLNQTLVYLEILKA